MRTHVVTSHLCVVDVKADATQLQVVVRRWIDRLHRDDVTGHGVVAGAQLAVGEHARVETEWIVGEVSAFAQLREVGAHTHLVRRTVP